MKAAMYYNNNDVRIIDIPKPQINDEEILVKTKASGVCGTDVMEWYRIKKAPRIQGHEIAGEIVESKNEKFKIGERVFVSHHVPCNNCKYCNEGNHTACETLHKGNFDPGGFSEFIRVPKINVEEGTYLLPDDMTYEEGSMIEPLACCVRGQRVVDVKKEHTVLILGSGVFGILNIQLAKHKGAKVIATDIEEYKLKKAKEFGADEVYNAKDDFDVKADRIIVCTGALSAYQQAFKCIDKAGVISCFAVPSSKIEVPSLDFWRNELTMKSSYGAAPIDLEESLELIKNKNINVKDMITHKLPLDKAQEGFKIAAEAKESLKVILEP